MDFELKVTRGERSGRWFISSPQFRGLNVSGRTFADAMSQIEEAAAGLRGVLEGMEDDGSITDRNREQLAAYRAAFTDAMPLAQVI